MFSMYVGHVGQEVFEICLVNLFVGGHFLEFVKCKYSAGGKNILRKDYSSALIFGILENVLVNGFVSETVFLFRCPRDLRNIHCMFFY